MTLNLNNAFGDIFTKARQGVRFTKAGKPPECVMPVESKASPSYAANYAKWQKGLSGEKKEAIETWMMDMGDSVRKIRLIDAGQGAKLSLAIRRQAYEFRTAISSAPNWKGRVFRGLSLTDKQLEQLSKVDSLMRVKAASSATPDAKVAHQYMRAHGRRKRVLLDLRTQTGRDVGSVFPDQWEKEIVLPKGSKYRIESVIQDFYVTSKGKKVSFTRLVARQI